LGYLLVKPAKYRPSLGAKGPESLQTTIPARTCAILCSNMTMPRFLPSKAPNGV